MYFHFALKSEKTVLKEREAALIVFSTPQYVSDIQTLFIYLFIHSFFFLIVLLPGSLFIKHLWGLTRKGFVLHVVKVDGIWSIWFPAAALILAYSALAILSSIYSSLQLLTPTESEQGQLLLESLILCYHDDVPQCFHHKLLLSETWPACRFLASCFDACDF